MNIKPIFLLLLFIFLSINANAETYTVTKIADTNDGVCNGDCSLREAITVANGTAANDVIIFDASVFATPQTITLGGTELGIFNNGSLTINGLNGLTVSGNNASRVFLINSSAVVTLNSLAISNGRFEFGGGIFNDNGTLTIKNSTISNNAATGNFGGSGGGISNGGVLNIINSTLSGNQAVSGNSGGFGGAIYNAATVRLTNSTIAFNTAPGGGGIWNAAGTVTSGNSIIANNFGSVAFDFFGTLTSQGYNLIGNTNNTTITGTTTGNILDVPAGLGPPAKNGDESFTHALLAGSPALDTGLNSLAVDENGQPLTTDQRGAGFPRIFGTAVDIGAFEAGNPLNLTVDTNGDSGSLSACTSAAGDCSLRGAISRANSLTGNDTITFDPSVFAATQTITLGGSELIIAANGSLTLDGINGLRISGNNISRIFTVNAGAVVNFNNLTLSGGRSVTEGGAIFNSGTITVTNSTISGNTAINNGGAIFNSGIITVTNSTFSGNTAGGKGGAIYHNSGALALINSTVSGNGSNDNGTFGGGIYVNSGSLNLTNSTIAFNAANSGGGVFNSGGTVNAGNTIIARNSALLSRDFSGTLNSRGYNLIGNTILTNITGIVTGNLLDINPQLAPLQNNGGGTFTHAPLSGSPAINAGNNSLALDAAGQPLMTDQRGAGFPRILNGRVDIGAFESALPPPPPDFVVDTVSDDNSLSACTAAINDCSLRSAIALANATAGNETINFDSGVFASSQTITLANGNLPISNDSITINGINGLRISGNDASRIFLVAAGATLNLNNLTLTGGFQGGDGGAIFSQGTLNLTNSTISANRSTERGGGIFNFAGTVNLVNSTISGNFLNAVSQGGGIYNLSGTVNSTNSTITNNSAGDGGGIYNDSGTVNAGNTIIAGNNSATSPDFFGTLDSRGYNLIGSTNLANITGITSGNILNVNAGLAPLANNGGGTFTHQLLATSPAIDGGNNALAVDTNGQPLTTDQRGAGFSRVLSASVDIGSVENREAVLIVDTLSDDGSLTACTNAPNDCSLRGAILRSANIINTVISFDSAVFASPQTITLTNGNFTINNSSGSTVTINSSNGVRISGNNTGCVFTVSSTIALQGLTITDGNCGVRNSGTLTVTNSTISGNSGFDGRGIYNTGTVNLMNSTISGNSSGTDGGGIYNSSGIVTLTNSTISGNSARKFGGGIFNSTGTVTLTNSTISGNSTRDLVGGGIYSIGNSSMINLRNSTISGNSASSGMGGGIYGNVSSRNSIIAGNSSLTSGPDILGILTSQGYNLIGSTFGATINGDTTGNILNEFVRLAPLGFYGGPTMTHALLSNSPAINAGNITNSPTLDQRGAARIGTADIGAFELNNTENGGSYVAALPNGSQNVGYNFTLAPNNGILVNDLTFDYSVTSGSLPNGLSLTNSFAQTTVVAISGIPTQGGTFNFTITATNGVNSNTTNYTMNVFAPTAAGVNVSGRVLTPEGRGLTNASVTLTDTNGITRTARTSSFGYYHFTEIAAGQTYIIAVRSKRYEFAPQAFAFNEDVSNLNFFAGRSQNAPVY